MAEKQFKAEYRHNRTSLEKSVEIEKMVPVFNDLACLFKIDIAVNCYDGPVVLSEDDNKPGLINFNIDGFPSLFRPISTLETQSIFGFVPTKPLSVKIVVPAKNTPQYRLAKTDLYSPEGQPMGCVLGSNIFIYPDILTSNAWNDETKKNLLLAICYWFLPRVISNNQPEHQTAIKSGLSILRSGGRGHLLFNVPRDGLRSNFSILISNCNSKTIDRLEEKISETEQKIAKLSNSYFESLSPLVENIARLESIKTEMVERDFGKEFESLMIMDSIETIRIKNENYIVIKTAPISQVPTVDHKNMIAESYDIGEFVIEISTIPPKESVLSRSAIRFHQDTYLGPYKHIHISPDVDVCFGTVTQADSIGMNPIIDNLIAKFDLVPLVHLILTFMKKEKSVPRPREKDKWDSSAKPKPDRYKNTEEREVEKNNFIKLVSNVVLRSSIGQLEKELVEMNKKVDALHAEIIVEKEILNNNLAILQNISDFLVNTGGISKQLALLLDDESIFGLFISTKELVIYFHCQRGDLFNTEYGPEDFILKITPDSSPKLLALSPKKSMQSIALIDPSRFNAGGSEKNDEVMIKNLQLGHISDILTATKEKIINEVFDHKTKSSEKKEAKNGR